MKKVTIHEPTAKKSLVYAQATYYPNFVRIWIPNKPKIYQDKSTSTDSTIYRMDVEYPYETSEERSLRRSRKSIIDYALCNEFDLFATFTFGENRADDDKVRKKLATWLKNQRTRNGKFRYVVVPERHKTGELHFHALIGGYKGKIKFAINPHTGKKIKDSRGNYVRNFSEYRIGINSAKTISEDSGEVKTAYYLQKYITKDAVNTFGKNRLWVSHGLKKPLVEENPEEWYLHVKPDREHATDYGIILEFDINSNPLTEMFSEGKV
ncbi:MAG: hypothetical protein Q7T74_00230 [Candidatus Saccharibacteria bacterium]|nr:hypothetical protein [Candidatus Saccharibacteria bacterium]